VTGVQISGANLNFDVAMARQRYASEDADGPVLKFFREVLQRGVEGGRDNVDEASNKVQDNSTGAASPSKTAKARLDARQIETKLNEAIALTFIAPMLTSVLNESEQTYFVNSPTEQAYARQMYMQIASKIGQSGKLPLARNIAQAFVRRLAGSAQATTT